MKAGSHVIEFYGAELISKDMNAGVYTTEWNASGFASGVYYYRIAAGDFVQTKKLILLK